MAQTFNYPLNIVSNTPTTISNIFIPSNATIGNVFYNTLTVGNMLSNNLNLGSVSMFSGSFSASNNQVSAANVTGLIFSNSNINYFEIILTVGITTSIPSTLNAVYTIRGNYNSSGWAIAVSYIGDNTGVAFSINSSTGQISYTSTNISFWTSDIFRYRVEQITSTGTYTSLIAGATTSNYSFSTLQILSTTDALPNNNIGALQVAGGVTIAKELFIGGTSFFNTAGSLGINTTNISYNLDVSGTARFTTSVTTGILSATSSTITNIVGSAISAANIIGSTNISSAALYSTNITTTNIVGTAISAANIIGSTNISSAALYSTNITTTNIVGTAISAVNIIGSTNISSAALYSTNITTTNLVASFTSLGNLISSTGTFANKVGGSQTVGTIVVTTSASLIGNTNTLGNLYTTGGNVGINTVTPGYTLDVNGSSRVTKNIDIGGTQPIFNNSTLGTLFITGTTNNVNGILMNTSQDIYPTYQIGNLAHDNIVQYYDMYYDGTNNRASSNTGSFIISKNLNRLNFISGGTGSAGSIISSAYSMVIGSTGNIGINNTSPAFTLDVNGSGRFNNSLLATFNSNTIGNIYTTGGNVGIGIVSPSSNLHVNANILIDSTNNTGLLKISSGNNTNYIESGLQNITNSVADLRFTNMNAATTFMIIASTGNVGVGTATPSAQLDIISTNTFGNLFLGTNAQNRKLVLYSNNLNEHQYYGFGINAGALRYQVDTTSADHVFYAATGSTTSNELFRIKGTGNVGIGTNSPGFTLDVNGSGRFNNTLLATFNSNTLGNIFTTGGNVAINTISPSAYSLLTINGGNSITGVSQASIAFSYAPLPGFYHFIGSRHNGTVGSNQNALDFYLYNSTGATGSSAPNFGNVNSMSVTANGVGIFNSTPSATLDVNGNIRCNYNSFAGITLQGSSTDINVNIKNTSTGGANFLIGCGASGSTSPGNFYIFDNVSNNFRLNINSSGNIGVGTVSPGYPLHVTSSVTNTVTGGYFFGNNTGSIQPFITSSQAISIFASTAILTQTNFLASSDLRIKNVCDEEINLNLIDNINPVIYTYKDIIKNSKKNIGFIAQNVVEFCPEAVTLHKEIIPDIMKLVDIIENKDTIITIKNEWKLKKDDIIKIIIDDKDINGELITIIYSNKDIIKFKHLKLKKNVFVYGRQVTDFHELNYDYVFALGFAGIQKSRKEIKELKQDNILLKQDNILLKQDVKKLTEFIKLKFSNEFK